ncbi:excinuclease ABC subunit C [Thermosipho melanesiensis]|uniref:UvrABC system protein C n=2 Tax=Thermosipho melanesiensis TaxID=46541 RepID=A6LNS4_THEM4|nr:excinuclease ABC subunit UvrC [Thermosipho melanesiensis]ABR31575.1 excinuclease ABC, C subunit [Thermosipho melanesiensis BI429]APT74608.1 excinuclease ABC subunit C [Thermosipho melanesiensis]OOC35348.1 excinuclease ABC subunit C [Thermosipho melanesiensis]OOC35565.1 excinuclease ABC subunit C [Thermosipho melanesiensis]OOC36816.1 excinuclease ABC subunit C [Thermosipho melanesiensis]
MIDREILKNIPEKPGVYIFKRDKEYVYIGKSKNLKKRLNSHFSFKEEKSRLIVEESNKLETIIVKNEKESLLLEATLIYKYKPKYNVMLKESEPYPYIRISSDVFPYVEVTRNRDKDGKYFGPYTNVKFTRLFLEVLQKILNFRTCKKNIEKIKKPCLNYYLKTCVAPCVDENKNFKMYGEIIKRLEEVLSGDYEYIRNFIEAKMYHHAKMLDFENAAKYRDVLLAFNNIMINQGIVLRDKRNVDYIVFKDNMFLVLKVRSGVLTSKLLYEASLTFEEFIYQFYYGMKSDLPNKIVVSKQINLNFDVPIIVCREEDDKYLLEIALENLTEHIKSINFSKDILIKMKEILNLKKIPFRIEGTDISHRNGRFTVASLIVFENGYPKKDEYRRYKLGDILDDFESIRIFIRKRYTKHRPPDLFFVDGGKGQVNAAIGEFNKMNIDIDVVGIAKEEEVIVTKNKSFKLDPTDVVLRTLIFVRDETHRVANSFSGKLKNNEYKVSKLDSIKGIGPKRKKQLLMKFGTLKNIKSASLEELEEIVGKTIALRIKEEL